MLTALLLCSVIALSNTAAANRTAALNPAVIAAVANSASCSWGWKPIGRRCFIFQETPRTWAQAELNCIELGGNLASIHRRAEYVAVVQMIAEQTGNFPLTWLGGNDAVEEGTWFWSDGTSFDFTNWAAGEPDNFGGNNLPWRNFIHCCPPFGLRGRPIMCPLEEEGGPPPFFPCPGNPPIGGENQHCMTMNYEASHSWDDDFCYEKYPSVCAMDG